jgi:hypothetical protein
LDGTIAADVVNVVCATAVGLNAAVDIDANAAYVVDEAVNATFNIVANIIVNIVVDIKCVIGVAAASV